jgi:hypothetical protein
VFIGFDFGFVSRAGSGGTEDQNDRVYADTPTLRAAAANYLHKGLDGCYIHSMRWPLGEEERDFIRELGDRDALLNNDRRIVLPRRSPDAAAMGYVTGVLPVQFIADPSVVEEIPLYIAGSTKATRIRGMAGWEWAELPSTATMHLMLSFRNIVAADSIVLTLNGESLDQESREYMPRNGNRGKFDTSGSYDGLRVVVPLNSSCVRGALKHGANTLGVSLAARPNGLMGGISLEEVEVTICNSNAPKL